jgi:hypothetical protein
LLEPQLVVLVLVRVLVRVLLLVRVWVRVLVLVYLALLLVLRVVSVVPVVALLLGGTALASQHPGVLVVRVAVGWTTPESFSR